MMKSILRKFLLRRGYLVVTKKYLAKNTPPVLFEPAGIAENEQLLLQASFNGGIREQLIREGKTRWLEIGCGGTFEEHFTYIDLFPEPVVNRPGRYFRFDIVHPPAQELSRLGTFDLVRMQHVFEHFTPEDGCQVLHNIAELLKPGGFLLISAPDLRKYISLYLSGTISNHLEWAHRRIRPGSPDSFYFSIFSHSMRFEKHEWCYDAEGIKFQLDEAGRFTDITELTLDHPMANIPFTHNRPKEDVVILARKK